MPEFGVMFKLNADYDHVKWYGFGPEETYADRRKGAKLGIYENAVKDNMARYIVPQECGAKEEVRYAAVTDRAGRGMLFEMDEKSGPDDVLRAAVHIRMNLRTRSIRTNCRRYIIQSCGLRLDRWENRRRRQLDDMTHPEYLLNVQKKMEFHSVSGESENRRRKC